MTAVSIGWHSAMLSNGRFEDPSAQACRLDNVDGPDPYGEADYRKPLDFSNQNGFFTIGDKDGCTVEFPWDEGAVSNTFAVTEVRRK